jgi:hypothetical protein
VVGELTFVPTDAKETGEFHKYYCFQQEGFKFIGFQRRKWSNDNPGDFTGEVLEERFELYDMKEDPEEKENLYGSRPKIAENIRKGYEKELERMARHRLNLVGDQAGEGRSISVPEDIRKKLEGLGYGGGAKKQ